MHVIYLNGASSSGKSSIARELQKQLPDYYLYIEIDTFISMIPAKANRWDESEPCDGFTWKEVVLPTGDKGMRVQSGNYGKCVDSAFHTVVLALLKSGHKLIIDDVADGINEVAVWNNQLSEFQILRVGVKCSLPELQRREHNRQDRMNGSGPEQYYRVHEGVEYDLTVSTDAHSPEECALKIVSDINKPSMEP